MPPMKSRQARVRRETKETRIEVELTIDGTGKSLIKTGIPFFDHMLTLFAKHGVMDLKLRCKGDLEVDAHHTVEDCGIALGQAFLEALGDKKGIRRYGFAFGPERLAGCSEERTRGARPSECEHSAVGTPRPTMKGEAYVPMDECLARCV